MTKSVGKPLDRVDGVAKVTGVARFTTDVVVPGLVHAVVVTSPLARGRITGFDLAKAKHVEGVLGILTHQNAPRLHQQPDDKSPWSLSGMQLTMQDDRVRFDRQPVAVAIAETLEAAQRAADCIRVYYEAETPRTVLDDHMGDRFNPGEFLGEPADFDFGDFDQGWQQADVRLEARYSTPREHHNPIELHNTVARWDGDQLEVHDSTQFVYGVRERLSTLFGLPADHVRVICEFVGGGFGSKGQTWPHAVLCAMAAKLVDRPVRLVLKRDQLFGIVGYRSPTRQLVRLGASKDGRLVAHYHESTSQTSMFADYVEPIGRAVTKLYACPNTSVRQRLVRLDVNTPTFMRAPGDSTGLFALEVAMDELSYALGMDPLQLRLVNYAEVEPGKGRPWSSKGLKECYRQAAERFGWDRRPPEVRARRDGREWIGWGMASASLHTARMKASARVRVHADGTATIETASHELGTGTYTILTQIASDALGVDPAQVRVALGDTRLPMAPLSAGSQTTASVGPIVHEAALGARKELIRRAIARSSALQGVAEDSIEASESRLYVRERPEISVSFAEILEGEEDLVVERQWDPVDEDETPEAMRSFGCHFVEVRVDEDLGTVRVSRYVGAFSAGRAMNRKTATSQLSGAVVWGLGMALLEEAQVDPDRGRVLNANLGQYLIPVNADVPELEVLLVEEDDHAVNVLGAKGLGELGITGLAPAVANAVYHATGKRVRELPITPSKLLE